MKQIIQRCTVNKTKKFKKCLIIYGPEYFVCTVVVQVYKDVLCGREEWSLSLREGHGLGFLEKRLLRKIFGPKRDEVTGDWRRLHNEEFYDLYSSPNIIRLTKSRRMRWEGHVARMEGEDMCIKFCGGET